MRRDHRPFWLRKLHARYESWWAHYFLFPQFDHIGVGTHVKKPWNVEISGANVTVGDHLHLICEKRTTTRFCVWPQEGIAGKITIGDHVLLSPGIQLIAARAITIADNCMLAGHVYISDSDWHGLYDRTAQPDSAAPVVLEENSWIGYGATILKGVTIGRNSVVGAGAVVSSSVPAHTVVAGNPAREVKKLDPSGPFITRSSLFQDPATERLKEDYLYALTLRDNSIRHWLRTKIAPKERD